MPHSAIALIHLFIASVVFFLSYRQFQKGNFQLSAGLIVLGGLILRVFVASDLFLHEWDERYHALVAKNLMSNLLLPRLYASPLLNYDCREWASNYIWLHKQ